MQTPENYSLASVQMLEAKQKNILACFKKY